MKLAHALPGHPVKAPKARRNDGLAIEGRAIHMQAIYYQNRIIGYVISKVGFPTTIGTLLVFIYLD